MWFNVLIFFIATHSFSAIVSESVRFFPFVNLFTSLISASESIVVIFIGPRRLFFHNNQCLYNECRLRDCMHGKTAPLGGCFVSQAGVQALFFSLASIAPSLPIGKPIIDPLICKNVCENSSIISIDKADPYLCKTSP